MQEQQKRTANLESSFEFMVGEIRSDVKHILASLDNNKNELNTVRNELSIENKRLEERLDKVERFNIRIVTYASLAVPVLSVLVQIAVRYFLE